MVPAEPPGEYFFPFAVRKGRFIPIVVNFEAAVGSRSFAPIAENAVTGQGRGRNIAALLVGTPGELPSGVTPDHRFLLRFDIDGVSSQVLISVYGEKVFYISLSGEESDMMLSDYGWSSLRAKIYN